MNTRVIAIKPLAISNSYDASVSIGENRYSFLFEFESDTIADLPVELLKRDDRFVSMFSFNHNLAEHITALIFKVHKGESVDFPVDVGEFGTYEEAMIQMKPWRETAKN
jgi:hypothetical protein